MPKHIPEQILDGISLAHPSWQPILLAGLEAITQSDQTYLTKLAQDAFLPDGGRLFAAFSQPLEAVRFVLFGEGPYPRAESATGFCFMDGAVGELWSENGLSKKVNRATSLRNFMKMLLVADGQLSVSNTTGDAIAPIGQQARSDESPLIQTLNDMQRKLQEHGFLLLNATLVYRPHVAPAKESKAWLPFVQIVLQALANHASPLPELVLWGKIAENLTLIPVVAHFPKTVSEHPYNLSFIANPAMQSLFGPMNLLQKAQ